MPLQSIATKLRLTIGLATESLGSTALESAVKLRVQALGLSGLEEY